MLFDKDYSIFILLNLCFVFSLHSLHALHGKKQDSAIHNKKVIMTFYKILSPGSIKVHLILLISLLTACTQVLTPVIERQLPAEVALNDTDKSWYAARFSLNWEAGQEPQWYLGTLLAGEIITPILDQYAPQITCWRIHRRAVHDKTGHVFSFIFYSSEASAAMI